MRLCRRIFERNAQILSMWRCRSGEHVNSVEQSTVIIGMKMIVMTRGGLKSPCQHGACGMGDMKIPRETDDANDPDDSSGV